MSNVNFSFGTDLLGNFVTGNGVYVYATVFAGGTWVQTSRPRQKRHGHAGR